MYVLYLLAEGDGECEIVTRQPPYSLRGTESVWMVPGTVSADD